MRYWISSAVLLIASVASAETRSLVVEKIEDGDTIVVMLNGKPERLQLQGIDAPEDVENAKLQRDIKVTGLEPAVLLPLGRAATRHLQSLVKPGDTLQVSGHFGQRDRYGRILVVAEDAAGRSLNERMVQDGYAVVTRYGVMEAALKAQLERAESEAIASKRGLWREASEVAQNWSGRKN
ncbi:MAG: thermonuclease family protein [Candidatus Polarisedimenticolaceae bacterium]|nr:thermonuclease family protein [Candidatus Polarisedimenticolaceae bacterium]